MATNPKARAKAPSHVRRGVEALSMARRAFTHTCARTRSLTHEREHAGAIGELPVVAPGARVAALVQHFEVARVDGEGFVRVLSHEVAVADVVRPSGAREGHVGFAGE